MGLFTVNDAPRQKTIDEIKNELLDMVVELNTIIADKRAEVAAAEERALDALAYAEEVESMERAVIGRAALEQREALDLAEALAGILEGTGDDYTD